MCQKGSCHIKIRSTQDEVVLHEGNSCLIPAAIADYDIEPVPCGEHGRTKSLLLDAFLDNRRTEATPEHSTLLRKLSRFLHLSRK